MEMDSIRLKTKEIQQQYNMVLTSLEGHEVATVVIRVYHLHRSPKRF